MESDNKLLAPALGLGLALIPSTPSKSTPHVVNEDVQNNPELKHEFPSGWENYEKFTMDCARENGIPADIFLKQLKVENDSGNPRAKSGRGARGIAQLMPLMQDYLGVSDPFDPYQSIEAGARLMGELYKKHNNNYEYAIMEYNMGGPKFHKWLTDPDTYELPAETKAYVSRIMSSLV